MYEGIENIIISFVFLNCESSISVVLSSACCCMASSVSQISKCSGPVLVYRATGCIACWTADCCKFCCIALELKAFTSQKCSSSNLVNCGVVLNCVANLVGYLIVSVGCIIASWINTRCIYIYMMLAHEL